MTDLDDLDQLDDWEVDDRRRLIAGIGLYATLLVAGGLWWWMVR